MRYVIQIFVALILGLAVVPGAFADGGGGGMGEFCRVRIGKFTLMFSAYQPHLTGDRKFCTDIPGLGKTNLVFDYESQEGTAAIGKKRELDKLIKEMKLGVRVVREDDGKVIVEEPPKKMRGSLLETVADFDKPGNYEIDLVLVDPAGKETKEHVELTVGVESGAQLRAMIIAAVVLIAAFYLAYLSIAGFREKVDAVLAKLKSF